MQYQNVVLEHKINKSVRETRNLNNVSMLFGKQSMSRDIEYQGQFTREKLSVAGSPPRLNAPSHRNETSSAKKI